MGKIIYYHYVFLDQINSLIKKNLLQCSNISIIINLGSDENKRQHMHSIIKFAKNNKIPFIIKDNYKDCIKYKADGIFIDSKNKKIIRPILIKKNFLVLGGVHNQLEYNKKLNQKCSMIMLSPLFYNEKYSKNKIMNVLKFNNKALNWKIKICALGGINSKNLKKIKLTKSVAVAYRKKIFESEINKDLNS